MAIGTALVGILICFLAVRLWRYLRNPLRSIPGPKRLPFIGIAHKMHPMSRLHVVFNDWAKRYGSVMYAPNLGGPVVWCSDFESIYEVTVKKGMLFGARMFGFRASYCLQRTGVLTSTQPDNTWRSLRKICHLHLKQFGDGMSVLEGIIKEISEDMFAIFAERDAQEFDPHDTIFDAALNNVAFLITGRRSRTGDDIVEKFRLYESTRLKYATPLVKFKYMLIDFFPWIRHLGYKPWQKIVDFVNLENDIWRDLLELHHDNPETRSLVRTLLAHLDQPEGQYQEMDVRKTVVNLIFAGVTTTSNTFYAAINVLAHAPDIQEAMYNEIESVVGRNQSVELSKRSVMPYCRAVLYEIMRYTTVLPMSVVHCNNEETTIKGYRIPRNTSIRINLYGLHYDQSFWNDPETFDPGRFLDESGEVVPADHPNRKHLMPFGAGPRVCLAESFAMARLFLWLTTLIQRMKVVPAPGNTKDLTALASATFDGVIRPLPYKVVFHQRH